MKSSLKVSENLEALETCISDLVATLSIQVKKDDLPPTEPNLKTTIQEENIIKYTYHNVDLPPVQFRLEATMRNKILINHSHCTNTYNWAERAELGTNQQTSGPNEENDYTDYGIPSKLNTLEICDPDLGKISEDINFISHTKLRKVRKCIQI